MPVSTDTKKPMVSEFGCALRNHKEVEQIGSIKPHELAQRYAAPAHRYLPGLSWDPRTARFRNVFSRDPWGDAPRPDM